MKKLISFLLGVLVLCTGVAVAAESTQTVEVTVDSIREVATEIGDYDKDVGMLARLMYSEARGVKSKAEQAAVVWCVLNRVDSSKYPDTIKSVITAKSQFAYKRNTPVKAELRDLAEDVITRWLLEQKGVEEVGRTLPKNYLYFAGRGGRNYFRTGYRSRKYWDWSMADPYK